MSATSSAPLLMLVSDPALLARISEGWASSRFLAVDTEFVRVDSYHAKLCLIQVRDENGTMLIDAADLAQLSTLLDALYDPRHIKVFHAAGQDLEIFVRLRNTCPQPLFDTQVAATLLGYGDQLGYAALIERRLGITLDKSLSRTDWSRRPLSPAALAYAAADVEHLAEIYPALESELARCGRLAWLAEDCARLCEPAQYLTRPEDAWRRLKGLARLRPREQTVAVALATWRETEAQRRDRPRKWILDDEPLYRLAQRQPGTLADLEALDLLPPKTLSRVGETLVELIHDAQAQPEQVYARDEEPDTLQKAALKRLQSRMQTLGEKLNLPPSFLAPRAELLRLVREGPSADIVVLKGWRREVCGAALIEMLP